MSDLYLARLVRKRPPRIGDIRVMAIANSTAAVEIDNDIFQYAVGANPGLPGDIGRLNMFVSAESNDAYVLFGPTNAVAANSADTSGNGRCRIVPAGTTQEWEIDPAIDLWMSATTKNGSTNTATIRYGLSVFLHSPKR